MRSLATADRVRELMSALGGTADAHGAAYFTGGATGVLLGWRETTIDVDILFVPERDALLRELPRLKDVLQINVELASPADFIARALALFEEIEPELFRFPAVDAASFKRRVEEAFSRG